MKPFEHDFAEYDEFGLVRIRCMSCATPIAERSYVEVRSKLDSAKMVNVLAMKRLSNWRDVSVDLSDGSYTNIKMCKECEHTDIAKAGKKIMAQIRRGWDKEMDDAHVPVRERARHQEKYIKVSDGGR